jgi:hypothetical protein
LFVYLANVISYKKKVQNENQPCPRLAGYFISVSPPDRRAEKAKMKAPGKEKLIIKIHDFFFTPPIF